MTQNDVDFERDLSDAFAPVKMPAELHQRLLAIPRAHTQRRANWLKRLLPQGWYDEMSWISTRPAFGMTTGAAAACCSLVIGLSLGLGGMLPQTQVATSQSQTVTIASTTTTSETDPVSMLYAAADMSGDLP